MRCHLVCMWSCYPNTCGDQMDALNDLPVSGCDSVGTAGDDSNTPRYALTWTRPSKSGGGEPSSRIRLGYTGNQELCICKEHGGT